MSAPKFSVGEAVMIRSRYRPEYDCDFAIVTARSHSDDPFSGFEHGGWHYKTSKDPAWSHKFWYLEESLRPIPKEKPNGIDAKQYIKDLCGQEVRA